MAALEQENLPTPPTTPSTAMTTACSSTPTGILIEGVSPPPQIFTFPNTQVNETTRPPTNPPINRNRSQSNLVNHPRRNQIPRMSNRATPHHQSRRCLLHLTNRCPICFRQRNADPRIFRQDGIRAILDLIFEVFGVRLNPRELALFIAGYYA